MMAFHRDGNTLHMLDLNNQDRDEASQDFISDSRNILVVEFQTDQRLSGALATTLQITAFSVFTDGGANFTPDELNQSRAMFASQLVQEDMLPANLASELSQHTLVVVHRDWTGYLANSTLVASVLGFIVSLSWIPRTPAYFRARRAARGLCPHCGYSLAGLTSVVCPECGGRSA